MFKEGGGGKKKKRQLQRLGREAAEYCRSREVPQRLEEALNTLFLLRPADLYGDLANYFSKFSKAPVICKLVGRKVLDGVGRPTLEVEIYCIIKNYEKRICSTVISSHSQILENALSEATEDDEKERNDSVNTAVEWVNDSLNTMLRDLKPTDQCKVDKILGIVFTSTTVIHKCTYFKPRKYLATALHLVGKKVSGAERTIPPAEPVESVLCGSLAIGGTSLAIAKAGATISRIPLYVHIALLKHDQVYATIFSFCLFLPIITSTLEFCNQHLLTIAGFELALCCNENIQEMPSPQLADRKKGGAPIKRISHLGCLITGCDNLEQPLLLMQTACNNIGLELGTDMYLAINCAAHEVIDYLKGKYEILTGTFKSPDEMVDMYVELINKFPSIIALVDPLRKEDRQQWNNICCALGSKCYLIAEDAATSISKLITDQDTNLPKCSGIVLKYINQTKVSDLIELTGLSHGEHITILGSPDGESSDDSLVDLAVGLGAKFIKLGGLCRGERVTKYNRLLAIEEELAKNRTLRMSFFLTLFSALTVMLLHPPHSLSAALGSGYLHKGIRANPKCRAQSCNLYP
uniref:Enolase 4 n=1 Tax=Apteryx owenii TaxID=8824 RepID=A0A8B9QEN3_APTOW